jgi:hypothetical protein
MESKQKLLFFYSSFSRRRNYIWTKLMTEKPEKNKKEAEKTRKEGSWAVDTLGCKQKQTNKRIALTRQEHKKAAMRRQAKLNLPLTIQI